MVRLSTIGFTVVSLCLKESLAMPTRGCFVCHVHCLVHDGAVRSSPCRAHHENFGRNLYHMFVLAYSASQSFVCFELWYSSCFEVKCWIHTFPKWCSHIAMWILILLDHRGRHDNSFPTGVLLLKWIRSFSTSARSILCFLNGIRFIRPQVAFVFPALPPFSSRTQIS